MQITVVDFAGNQLIVRGTFYALYVDEKGNHRITLKNTGFVHPLEEDYPYEVKP